MEDEIIMSRKDMRKSVIRIALLLVSVSIAFIVIVLFVKYNEKNNYQKRGAFLIDKIENFRQIEKRLPNSVEELGLEEPMNSGPYYERKDCENYVIFFTIGFDETLIYYSDRKEWKQER